MIKCYGYYSNKAKDLRKKEEEMQKYDDRNDTNEMDTEIIKLMFSNMKRKKMGKASPKSI
ncbi:hypothetical protein [Clostridium formicaceticum]|uniref:Uncharacterized protein n=1 Tax=Clostridium formicaceticum TaxID=1497 RepID=A0AAC9RKN8_9CLOT|nr:hypothetical protein [Clostridium formicaceticum]AOY74634.1 hypothetical protein BJL90_00880 [Clostridium formicaceticum]ARE89001.1 hypothetical protein CLFO_34070 [Clostridium formicaceticum]